MAPTMSQNPDGSYSPASPMGWQEEHNRWQRFWLWVLRRPHCCDEEGHAAMQSPGTKAVVAVVLDETETLRAEVARQRTAADSARAAIANVVRILPADRHTLVAAGRVRDALFTPGPSLTVQHIREEHPEQEQT